MQQLILISYLFLFSCGEDKSQSLQDNKFFVGYTYLANSVFAMDYQEVNFTIIDISLQEVSTYWNLTCSKTTCERILSKIRLIRVWGECPLPSPNEINPLYNKQLEGNFNGLYWPEDHIIDMCVDEEFEDTRKVWQTSELIIHESTHHMEELLGLEGICIADGCQSDSNHIEIYWLDENSLVENALKIYN